METFTLTVNNQEVTVQADADTPLLWVLRESLGLTGTKYSCGQGLCGACTVHLDGKAIQSCITPIDSADGAAITTIEGLADGDVLHPIQQAWLEERVPQCGYCQPGQIMQAAALLSANPTPTDDEIDAAMSGNLCRCGTYQRIRNAIHRAKVKFQVLDPPNSATEAVKQYMRKEYSVLIGENTANRTHKHLFKDNPSQEERSFVVRGRNLVTGYPAAIKVTHSELAKAFRKIGLDMVAGGGA